MGWTNQQQTEITAPSDRPFAPGYDVMGIGSQLPPELQDSAVRTALVMYNSNWNPAATVPTVKFHFLGTAEFTNGTGFVIGMGSCPDPSIDQTAIVALNIVFMYPNDNTSDVFYLWQDSLSGIAAQLAVAANFAVSYQGFNTETSAEEWSLPGNAGT